MSKATIVHLNHYPSNNFGSEIEALIMQHSRTRSGRVALMRSMDMPLVRRKEAGEMESYRQLKAFQDEIEANNDNLCANWREFADRLVEHELGGKKWTGCNAVIAIFSNKGINNG